MNFLFVIAIIGSALMVVYALARGLMAFVQTNEAARNGEDIMAMHHKQNQMMFARVKWQAITIVLLIVLVMLAAGGSN